MAYRWEVLTRVAQERAIAVIRAGSADEAVAVGHALVGGGVRVLEVALTTTGGVDAIGRLADDLLENPLINSALQRALGARDRVAQAQETAMEALNIPSASTLDKIARRLRSISQRLDEVEDAMEKLDRRLQDVSRDVSALRREAGRADAVSASQSAAVPEG